MTQEEAFTILKTGANVFLTGEPGSGKTHTVNTYISWLRKHGIEPAITASTGIAATHIGGYTIHSWSGIGIRQNLSEYDLDEIAQNKNVSRRVRDAHVLIIDEVSMLSARTIAMVEAVCREVRNDERPFGGLQIVLVGDFFQLPPVVRREEYTNEPAQQSFVTDDQKGRFAFSAPVWERLNPLVCYLSEQHRQEDDEFLSFLTAVRRGEVTPEHRALLRMRYTKKADEGITQLYSHNANVDVLNEAELAKLPGMVKRFEMESHGPEKLVASLKRGCLSPETFSVKIGARVMFTKNDVQQHRYVNGTLGMVMGFVDESEGGYAIVKTHNGREIVAEPNEWRIEDSGRVLARVIQVPLRLAWAMTVHKSQGMSLDAAHMDLANAFEYDQGYVALSRVRTLKGLSIAGLNTRALEVHPEILAKDEEFRAASDAARSAFAGMPPTELATMHTNFVKACGGKKPDASKDEEPAKAYSVEKIREKHGNAYRPWNKEEETELLKRYGAGEKPKTIAEALGRGLGAITARLTKLAEESS